MAVLVTAAVAGVLLGRFDGSGRAGPPAGCVATLGSARAAVDSEQAANASLIATIALARGLPRRAVVVALATALQESKLHNVDYGDADSLGLFQQRPSQGWGTPAQVRDPTHATNAFFDALVALPDWRHLAVTVAAQRVQRSAYPDAYAVHEPEAAVLAAATTGSPAGLACTRAGTAVVAAPTLVAGLRTAFTGAAPLVRADPATVAPAAGPVPAALTLHVAVGRVGGPASAAQWSVASWLVARADRFGIGSVRVGNREWTVRSGSDGWSVTAPGGPSASATPALARGIDVLIVGGS